MMILVDFPIDVDECASNRTNSCQFACTNTLGGFKCRCPVGYYLSPNGNKCLGKGDTKYVLLYETIGDLVSMESLCCVGGKVKH